MYRRFKNLINNALRRAGREIGFFPVMKLFRRLGIDCVLDVGANTGQYGLELRSLGYRGKICSFEPQREAYRQLELQVSRDSLWNAYNYGLGSTSMKTTLNISGLSPSSSILALSDSALTTLPELAFVGTESIEIKSLNDVFASVTGVSEGVFLKVDTQGFEREVIQGALNVLSSLRGIQLEMSVIPQYQGELYAEQMISWVRELGFTPYWILPGHRDVSTMQLLQMDVLFFNNSPEIARGMLS